MSTPQKSCPKCHNDWGIEEVERAKPAAEGRPAVPARWRCEACYFRWEVPD